MTKSTRSRKTVQRMMPRVSAPPPYEWLARAIERFADRHSLTRAAACCLLLERGLKRDLESVRVLKLFSTARGAQSSGKAVTIPSFSISAEYADLPELVGAAVGELREVHVERARAASRILARQGLSKDTVAVRGWRTDVTIDDETIEGVVLQFAGADLPEEEIVDACDCVTDAMSTSDVMRALWAVELERAGLAPKNWRDRREVSVGWMHFPERVVRK